MFNTNLRNKNRQTKGRSAERPQSVQDVGSRLAVFDFFINKLHFKFLFEIRTVKDYSCRNIQSRTCANLRQI